MLDFLSKSRKMTVKTRGAVAGQVIYGSVPNNKGLRLRVTQTQAPGLDGPIKGSFEILDVGDNKHSPALEDLLGKTTDAQEVLAVIRQDHIGCVSVVNSNILSLELRAP